MTHMKTRYMLFDLDGTLLPMDTDYFLSSYLKAIASYFSGHVDDPQAFIRQVILSSQVMIDDLTSGKTNQDKFMHDFFPKVGIPLEELMPIFTSFYESAYPALKKHVSPSPLGRKIVETALEKGYKIGLATNPVFPREAVQHRMVWANIHDLPWELVTSYETSRYCKPHTAYYAEILEKLGAVPEECIHVGNDMDEDFAARSLGISVVMAEDCLINRNNRSLDETLFHGNLNAVLSFVNQRDPV